MTAGVVFHKRQGDGNDDRTAHRGTACRTRQGIDAAERRQIQAELEIALADREAMLAEADGCFSSEPPL